MAGDTQLEVYKGAVLEVQGTSHIAEQAYKGIVLEVRGTPIDREQVYKGIVLEVQGTPHIAEQAYKGVVLEVQADLPPLAVFPIVPDHGYSCAQGPDVVIHRFGSANAKIEQRFYLGPGSRRYTVRRAHLGAAELTVLRDFWENQYGPYGTFIFNAPGVSGLGTTSHTVRFANEPLSWQMLADTIASTGVTLIEVPAEPPHYACSGIYQRFPTPGGVAELLRQTQEIIPLLRIQPRDQNQQAITVSDRACWIDGPLSDAHTYYQPRLISFDGINQSIKAADDAQFQLGNADRAMLDLVNSVDLDRAEVAFSLFLVSYEVQIDLWKGYALPWTIDQDGNFLLPASEGIYELTLPYPARRVSRACAKKFNDGNGCPYATASTGNDTTHFPNVVSTACDKGYDTANGCMAHGMKRYFGGIIGKPQTVSRTITLGRRKITLSSPAATPLTSDSIYDAIMQEVYCDDPVWTDEAGNTHFGMTVPCLMAAGLDENNRYQGVGIVGEGPLTFGDGHTLDGMFPHGYPNQEPQDLRTIPGDDPAGAGDYMSVDWPGDRTSGDWHLVYTDIGDGGRTYIDNFAAGTAAVILRRDDDEGLQLVALTNHNMEAVVRQGIQGWVWQGEGSRTWATLTNPIWVCVNMLLRALGLRSATVAEAEKIFDVNAAVACAAICDELVTKLVGDGYEKQFQFQAVVNQEKPLRDWLTDVLQNCLGYYTWRAGKWTPGIRINSSAVEAFTQGNILFRSLQLAPVRPEFNYVTSYFLDREYKYIRNSVTVYDEDHATRIGSATARTYLKSQMDLTGVIDKSPASRIITTRLREELGGIDAAQWRAAREIDFRTTVLALNVEPGMVCSLTHPDMPGGTGEFRVTGWRLNKDFSIDIHGRTTTDEMYDLTIGPRPADVVADPVPVESPIVESPFDTSGIRDELAALADQLAAYGDDGMFTPIEKQTVRRMWEEWVRERDVFYERCNQFNQQIVFAAWDNYIQEFENLFTYLDGR